MLIALRAFLVAILVLAMSGSTIAQQPTGTPGSPSATTTIDGEQIPAPPQKFGGRIERTTKGSKPYWPARVVPPKGAPNVLLIMTDDSGYGVPSTFGGVIPTPALDRISSAVKIGGEASGADTIEGSAKRTAQEIADKLKAAAQRQGWI
jgi:arylsulfatase